MKKTIIFICLVLLVIGLFLTGGCTQQDPAGQKGQSTCCNCNCNGEDTSTSEPNMESTSSRTS